MAYLTGNKIYLSLLNWIKGQYDAAWGIMPCPEIGRLRTQTAELGCGLMPRVSCDPSGWDQGNAPLYCRTDTPSEYRGVKLLPQFPRLSILYPPQASERGGYWHVVILRNHCFSLSAAGRTADCPLHRTRGVIHAKRVRKVFAARRKTFRTLVL